MAPTKGEPKSMGGRMVCGRMPSCDPQPGSNGRPVISLAPRLKVKYVHAQEKKTARRLRKPTRKNRWTDTQDSHASVPAQWAFRGHRTLATAAWRPMVAMSPLSK